VFPVTAFTPKRSISGTSSLTHGWAVLGLALGRGEGMIAW